jgi:hypothetical protein
MPRKLSLVRALVGLMWLIAASLHAEPLACEPGSRPYLAVVFYQRGTPFGPLPPPASFTETRGALLICRDRRLLETRVFTRTGTGEDRLPFSAAVTKGRLKALSWTELTSAAQAIRIGFMSSCRLQLQRILGLVEARVTWHGAGTRTRTFQLSSFDDSLRACTPEEEGLWLSLVFLELEPGAQRIDIR